MKHILALLCCLSLCSILGRAQNKSSKSAMSDQQFVNFAGQTDMMDANLGQLAQTAASSGDIKSYAQKVVTDQTTDFQELWKAAHSASLRVPNAIDKEHDRTTIDPFRRLKHTTFEHRFVKEMIEGDTTAIDIYKKEATQARVGTLRSYAEEALPILEAHLAEAKKIEAAAKTMTKKG